MKRIFVMLVLVPLVLVGCHHDKKKTTDTPTPTQEEKMMKKDDGAMKKDVDENDAMEKEVMEDDKMMDSDHDSDSDEKMMDKESDTDEDPADEAMEKSAPGEYLAYSADLVGNGEETVVFFKASWCPACVANDKKLKALLPSEDNVTVLYADFDTEEALKKKYGVIQQDTFVRLDGEGNVVKTVSFPSDSALRTLIAKS